MTTELPHLVSLGHVPDANRLIGARRRHVSAIGRKRHGIDASDVAPEFVYAFTAVKRPQMNRTRTCGGGEFSIGRNGDCTHRPVMSLARLMIFARGRVP